MGRLDPQLEECVSEGVSNFLLEIYCRIIKRNLSIGITNDIINKYIDDIYINFVKREQGKIAHSLSNELLDNVKERIIDRIFNIMFENLSLSLDIKNKIFNYALNLIIKRCENFEVVEVNEEFYMRQKYPLLLICFEDTISSSKKLYNFDEFLTNHFDIEFNYLWEALKNGMITKSNFFKKIFKKYGEEKFVNTLARYPPFILYRKKEKKRIFF